MKGDVEYAYKLLKRLNPLENCTDPVRSARYANEPYVLSGDVYGGETGASPNSSNAGRGGWSWYTGSAAWLYRVILEDLFGVKRTGNVLKFNPKLPAELSGAHIYYKNGNGNITLSFVKSNKSGVTINGVFKGVCEINLSDNVSEVEISYTAEENSMQYSIAPPSLPQATL
jgi:cellobiose phosphorylase